jgi:predicted MFS family arabinose efflux permease
MRKYLQNPTARAFLLSNLLCCPFWGVFDLLPIILCKELDASPVQIATIVALKPLTALFAFYWANGVFSGRTQLIYKLVFSYFLKFIPFIFFPFFSNPWIFVISFGIHMLLLRGTTAPWMELLKLRNPRADHGKICSMGSIINYIGNASLPIFFGYLLDHFQGSWRWIFVTTSLIGLTSLWVIAKIPKLDLQEVSDEPREESNNIIAKPWKDSFKILRENPSFLRFQIGFFLGGAGLMMIHPVLPKFLSGDLQLSYTELLLATCFCKGLGFVVSSPFWVKKFNRSEILSFSSKIPLLAAIFPLVLLAAYFNTSLIFLAYLLYGVMQGASELSWKMSGPVFSKNQDSSPYSSINILAVGIRGCIFPYLGSMLYLFGGTSIPLVVGGTLCLGASVYLWSASRKRDSLPQERYGSV